MILGWLWVVVRGVWGPKRWFNRVKQAKLRVQPRYVSDVRRGVSTVI